LLPRLPRSPLFPSTTLFRSLLVSKAAMREGILYDMLGRGGENDPRDISVQALIHRYGIDQEQAGRVRDTALQLFGLVAEAWALRSEEHTSELQSRENLVCRL